MPLPRNFYRPFDRTYRKVTDKIALYDAADPAERRWLNALIDGFQAERDVWDTTPELSPYFLRCTRLKHRLLHLAVCAFLHISYDLPRVIANGSPGFPPWLPPSSLRGQWIYFDLASNFPEALQEIAHDRTVMGYPTLFTWLIPSTAMDSLSLGPALAHGGMDLRPLAARRL